MASACRRLSCAHDDASFASSATSDAQVLNPASFMTTLKHSLSKGGPSAWFASVAKTPVSDPLVERSFLHLSEAARGAKAPAMATAAATNTGLKNCIFHRRSSVQEQTNGGERGRYATQHHPSAVSQKRRTMQAVCALLAIITSRALCLSPGGSTYTSGHVPSHAHGATLVKPKIKSAPYRLRASSSQFWRRLGIRMSTRCLSSRTTRRTSYSLPFSLPRALRTPGFSCTNHLKASTVQSRTTRRQELTA